MATSPKGRFVPMPPTHPLSGNVNCSICDQPIEAGQIPTVFGDEPEHYFTPGPGIRGVRPDADPETIVIAHQSCAYPEE